MVLNINALVINQNVKLIWVFKFYIKISGHYSACPLLLQCGFICPYQESFPLLCCFKLLSLTSQTTCDINVAQYLTRYTQVLMPWSCDGWEEKMSNFTDYSPTADLTIGVFGILLGSCTIVGKMLFFILPYIMFITSVYTVRVMNM